MRKLYEFWDVDGFYLGVYNRVPRVWMEASGHNWGQSVFFEWEPKEALRIAWAIACCAVKVLWSQWRRS